jgi:hypothetical protein
MKKYYFQYGGNPDWYNNFYTELKNNYNNVKTYTGNLTLGGSAAIAIILHKLNMISELNTFDKPNDFDFMYIGKDISHPNIHNFRKSTHSLVKSITYTRINDIDSHLFNSFDLIFVSSRGTIHNIKIDDMYILHPLSLLFQYKGNDFDDRNHEKDERKIALLNKILTKIKDNEGNYIEGFQYQKFILEDDDTIGALSDISNLSYVPSSFSFESPVKKFKFDILETPVSTPVSTPTKGGSINDFYKQKYLKYKFKYLNLKKNI